MKSNGRKQMKEPEFMFPSSSILKYFLGSGAHFFNNDGMKIVMKFRLHSKVGREESHSFII